METIKLLAKRIWAWMRDEPSQSKEDPVLVELSPAEFETKYSKDDPAEPVEDIPLKTTE